MTEREMKLEHLYNYLLYAERQANVLSLDDLERRIQAMMNEVHNMITKEGAGNEEAEEGNAIDA